MRIDESEGGGMDELCGRTTDVLYVDPGESPTRLRRGSLPVIHALEAVI